MKSRNNLNNNKLFVNTKIKDFSNENNANLPKATLKNKCVDIQNIHFVGIGGVSMSSLAVWACLQGYNVSGSDIYKSEITQKLQSTGINIFYNHQKENVQHADLVIYSNATDENCEVIYAKMLGIKTLTRAEYLAQMLKEYKHQICVSGAHGKTTTTALIYNILKNACKKPSLHLGGNLCENGKSYHYNSKEYIVCEACEYKDAFLKLPASIGVVLNIAPEHLDYFKDYNGVLKSFTQFGKNSKNLVINYDFLNKNNVFFEKNEQKSKNIVTFGFDNGDFTVSNIGQNSNGTYSFDCIKKGQFFAHINLNLVGKHNILNSLASIAVCDMLGIAKMNICAGLQNFNGVERRFEYLHKTKFLVHDYAHHPEEISACLNEAFKVFENYNSDKPKSKWFDSNRDMSCLQSKQTIENQCSFANNILLNCSQQVVKKVSGKDYREVLFKNLLKKQIKRKKIYNKKLLVVFQPHTYSRTKTLFKDFINCFKNVPELVLLKTYSAREKYDYKGSACYLAKKIGEKALYFSSKQKCKHYILQKIQDGYGVLFLGAGDIYTFAKIVAKLC